MERIACGVRTPEGHRAAWVGAVDAQRRLAVRASTGLSSGTGLIVIHRVCTDMYRDFTASVPHSATDHRPSVGYHALVSIHGSKAQGAPQAAARLQEH